MEEPSETLNDDYYVVMFGGIEDTKFSMNEYDKAVDCFIETAKNNSEKVELVRVTRVCILNN